MLIINLAGLALIVLIIWWFWLYQPDEVALTGQQLVVVENGVYQPSHLTLDADREMDILFLRKDASPCAETLQFPDLDISESLPLNKTFKVHLPALTKGSYPFHCQMQMYRGEINVK